MDLEPGDEGAAALAIVTRFITHLRVNGLVSKETTLNLLTDAAEHLAEQDRDSAAALVNGFAEVLHGETPDDRPADDAILL